MDIGGCDVVVQTKFDLSQTLIEAIKAIESVWGTSVVEIDNPSEMFVYRSKAAAEAWDEEGWNEIRYAKDMVYLISYTLGQLTFVIENTEDETLLRIIDAITNALKP